MFGKLGELLDSLAGNGLRTFRKLAYYLCLFLMFCHGFGAWVHNAAKVADQPLAIPPSPLHEINSNIEWFVYFSGLWMVAMLLRKPRLTTHEESRVIKQKQVDNNPPDDDNLPIPKFLR